MIAIKHLEENAGEKLYEIGFDNDSLNMIPLTQAIKAKSCPGWIGLHQNQKLLCIKWPYQQSKK